MTSPKNPHFSIKKNNDTNPKTLHASHLNPSTTKTQLPFLCDDTCHLDHTQLKRYSNPEKLPKTTDDAPPQDICFGQSRAIKAIKTALNIHANGYHVFASGEHGLGKRTLILRLLKQYAQKQATPNDWVYVHNFADPRTPIALSLPAGQAHHLQQQITTLWYTAKKRLNQRFCSDFYQNQIETIKNDIHQKEQEAYEALNEEGKLYNLTLSFRLSDNKAIFISNNTQHSDNSEDAQNAIDHDPTNLTSSKPADAPKGNKISQKSHMEKRLTQLTITLEKLEDEANDAIESLHRELAKRILAPLFEKIEKHFVTLPEVICHLHAMKQDMIYHVENIVNEDSDEFTASSFNHTELPSRYIVNIMVSHQPNEGAPIIFEDLPTHFNLLGHVEQITQLGTVTTDVSMIRAGSLHRTNGGFLIIDANSLLEHPYAWQGLKRALQSKQIKLSSLEQMITLTGNLSLAPQPIVLDTKVILLGEPDLYYDLREIEPEFSSVFKIQAEFHDDVTRNFASEMALVAKMADMIQQDGLLPFNNHAQAIILNHLSQITEDQNKLSLHSGTLSQVLHEANQNALLENQAVVEKHHVEHAIQDIEERSNYLKELYWQEIKTGQQLIHTKGQAIGEINALTVISHADSEFGMPARLTALVQPNLGSGDILDIERDVELGGNLHAKGVLIMTSYLRALFSQYHSLHFSASIAFEQSYAQIDGDSATLAEACALLSALANVPINQSIAITGSMNQLGEVQAVGGINAKITGFFDICQERGLTGSQGVILPKANVHQLMLRDDIVLAVKNHQFHLFAVTHLTQALSLLTGIIADEQTKKGNYKKGSLFGKVLHRLKAWQHREEEKD